MIFTFLTMELTSNVMLVILVVLLVHPILRLAASLVMQQLSDRMKLQTLHVCANKDILKLQILSSVVNAILLVFHAMDLYRINA